MRARAPQSGLRAADWRLLLPAEPPRTAVCLGPESLRRAVESVGIDVVAPGAVPSVDLVAATRLDRKARAAFEALRPGGAVYIRSWRFPFGGHSMTARLRRLDFEDIAVYWPLGRRAATTTAWIPVRHPGAVRYFLDGRERPRIGRFALPSGLVRRGFTLASRGDLLAPLEVVARKPSTGSAAGLPAMLRRLDERPGGSIAHLALMLLAPGSSSISKLVALVFSEGAQAPSLVVKAGRTPAANAALEREAANLRLLEELPQRARRRTPALVLVDRQRDGSVRLVESFVTGRPLYTTLDRANLESTTDAAVSWLAGLVRPGHERQPLAAVVQRALAETGVSTAGEPPLSPPHLAADVPPTFEQRDFSPWNLLRDDDGDLGVVDWESAEPDGMPALDLVYFLATCGFILDRATTVRACVESYRRTLADPQGAAARALDRYARLTGLPAAALPALRALTWLVHLRTSRDLPPPDSPATLPAGADLFRALVQEELHRARDGS